MTGGELSKSTDEILRDVGVSDPNMRKLVLRKVAAEGSSSSD
jgi:hypothetical protein